MTFEPPRCPHQDCSAFTTPPRRFARWGSFRAACRTAPEQRYRCPACRRTFSRQTFRHDYRDRRPAANARLFDLLTSGIGLRQAGRLLELSCSGVQRKMRKIARTCAGLHRNLSQRLPSGGDYVLDEEETYEGSSIRTLTVPILIERKSWFLVAADTAPIRRLARRGTTRRAWQDAHEQQHGRRPDRSRECVEGVLRELDRRCTGRLGLHTDKKASYARSCKKVFGDRATHTTTAGTEARTIRNPLFPINATIAMSRDNCGRLRRKSWLVSKAARWLKAQLDLFAVYRNYVRKRFNRDHPMLASAVVLGLLPRRLRSVEVLRWQQDWGPRSIHPMSLSGARSI
jgi:transposase-like protein